VRARALSRQGGKVPRGRNVQGEGLLSLGKSEGKRKEKEKGVHGPGEIERKEGKERKGKKRKKGNKRKEERE
jgi:hypothetical protein